MPTSEFECLDSEVVYRNRWLQLREDRIVRGDGSHGTYSVVDKPDFAVIAAIEKTTIYLVEQYRYPVEGRYWELPQGSWKQQHVDPLDLARAELREETGLIAENMRHVGHVYLAYGFCNQGYDIFLATGLTQGTTQLDPEEHGLIARPFPIRTVETMICEGVIKDATTIAAFGMLKFKSLLDCDC